MSSPEPKKGREAKRRAILEAASTVFLRDGYERANVDAIAELAGVSKQTIYNHFGDKETLFLTVTGELQASMGQADSWADVRVLPTERMLLRLAHDVLAVGLREDLAAFRRLVTAEAARYPQLHQAWMENGPLPFFRRLTAELGERGFADPDRATRHFIAMISSDAQVVRMLGGGADELLAETVRAFLRAYGP